MSFVMVCPACSGRLKIGDAAIGKVKTCPKCRASIIITRPEPTPPPVPAPPPVPEAAPAPDSVPVTTTVAASGANALFSVVEQKPRRSLLFRVVRTTLTTFAALFALGVVLGVMGNLFRGSRQEQFATNDRKDKTDNTTYSSGTSGTKPVSYSSVTVKSGASSPPSSSYSSPAPAYTPSPTPRPPVTLTPQQQATYTPQQQTTYTPPPQPNYFAPSPPPLSLAIQQRRQFLQQEIARLQNAIRDDESRLTTQTVGSPASRLIGLGLSIMVQRSNNEFDKKLAPYAVPGLKEAGNWAGNEFDRARAATEERLRSNRQLLQQYQAELNSPPRL